MDRRSELRSLREISLALQNDRADLTNDLRRRMNTMLATAGYEATVAEATTLLTMISRRIAELE